MRPAPHILKKHAYVGGKWIDAAQNGRFSVLNAANGEEISTVPDMNADDAAAAIVAAHEAFSSWSALSPLQRSDLLLAWSELIVKNADELALLMTCEQGKPLAEAKAEIIGGAATVRWCAEEGRRLYGDFIDGSKPGTKIITSRHPVGVVGAITPWNFPVGMITRKVSPALATGCTVVLKPAESTPLCALALAELAGQAGIPAGVFNVVTSSRPAEIGGVFTSDHRVAKISFTGSTRVGKVLMAQAAQNIQKISFELGGNAPFIVFPSADLEKAVQGAVASKFRNAGQTCICANRIYVHEQIFNQFQGMFLQKIKGLKVGPGWEKEIDVGPLINNQAIEKIEKMIDSAKSAGAKILTGGKRHSAGNCYFEPTLMADVPEDQPIAKEEIFGPVAVLYPFRDEDDVVRRANDTSFGLSSYIYSQDSSQIWRVSDALQSGMVGINEPFLANDLAPFGGIKNSGIGKEGGKYGLLEFTNLKYRLFG